MGFFLQLRVAVANAPVVIVNPDFHPWMCPFLAKLGAFKPFFSYQNLIHRSFPSLTAFAYPLTRGTKQGYSLASPFMSWQRVESITDSLSPRLNAHCK